MLFQTLNRYVKSQFRKMQASLRNRGSVKWKHSMYLIRLLITGSGILDTGEVPVLVTEHREKLITIKRG